MQRSVDGRRRDQPLAFIAEQKAGPPDRFQREFAKSGLEGYRAKIIDADFGSAMAGHEGDGFVRTRMPGHEAFHGSEALRQFLQGSRWNEVAADEAGGFSAIRWP